MNDAVQIADPSTQQRTSQGGRPVVLSMGQASNATLDILPLQTKCLPDRTAWLRARGVLGQLARLPLGWNGAGADHPDPQTIAFAAIELASLERWGAPAPTINPSPDGAIYAEWHSSGLDIEVIFEAPYKIISLIEDARGQVSSFEGEDDDLRRSMEALKVLGSR
nr:hypothetical protein [uncultured Rhodopila sp.]